MADNKKILKDNTNTRSGKRPLPRTFWVGLYSYLLLIILLGVFSLLGWYTLNTISTIGLGVGIAVANLLVVALSTLGLDKRWRDNQLAFVQCLLAIAITGIALFYTQAALRSAVAILPLLWLISHQSNLTSRRLGIITIAAIAVYLASNMDILLETQNVIEKLQPLVMAFVLLLVYSSFAFSLRFIKRIRRLGIKQQRELQTLRRQLSDLALQDPLTNAYKRSFILRLLDQEKARVDRHGATFSVGLFKINDIETVNKNAGYVAGDQVIRHVADNLLTAVRKSDNVGRYRGCHFMTLLPATTKQGAYEFAERIQARIATNQAATIAGNQKVTLAISIDEYQKGETVDTLIQRLEETLEKATTATNNRIQEA